MIDTQIGRLAARQRDRWISWCRSCSLPSPYTVTTDVCGRDTQRNFVLGERWTEHYRSQQVNGGQVIPTGGRGGGGRKVDYNIKQPLRMLRSGPLWQSLRLCACTAQFTSCPYGCWPPPFLYQVTKSGRTGPSIHSLHSFLLQPDLIPSPPRILSVRPIC